MMLNWVARPGEEAPGKEDKMAELVALKAKEVEDFV